MALTIIATPKATNSNAFATVAEADAYNEAHVGGATWAAATDESKKAAIIMATRTLDNYLVWRGWRTERTQALSWPRGALFTEDGIEIDPDVMPQFMINATSELARRLIEEDLTADPDTKGFSEITVDVITLKIDKTDARKQMLNDTIMSFIGFYGELKSGYSAVVRLARV